MIGVKCTIIIFDIASGKNISPSLIGLINFSIQAAASIYDYDGAAEPISNATAVIFKALQPLGDVTNTLAAL